MTRLAWIIENCRGYTLNKKEMVSSCFVECGNRLIPVAISSDGLQAPRPEKALYGVTFEAKCEI
jgi:hypothetical protein